MALTAYQAHMKRELKGKMKGKTKAQRKAIFKAAARSWKKKGSKSKSKPKSKSVARRPASKSTGGRSTVAKNGFNTQKLYKYLRMGALAAPAVGVFLEPSLTPASKVDKALRMYSGYSMSRKQFKWEWLLEGWLPFAGASVATVGIPKVISMIRRM